MSFLSFWERKDSSLKELRNTRKWTTTSREAWKKAKENWIGEQCSEIEENLRKNKCERAYQLVKDLATVKQGKAATIQDRSGKCLTEEREILNRWTEYCIELYSMSQRQWRFISTGLSRDRHSRSPPNPSQRSEGCSTVIEEREIGWSRQYLSRTGPSRWRGCNYRSHDNLQ